MHPEKTSASSRRVKRLFLLIFVILCNACVSTLSINPNNAANELVVRKAICRGDWVIAQKTNGSEMRFEACKVTNDSISGCDGSIVKLEDVKTLSVRRAQDAGRCLLRSW